MEFESAVKVNGTAIKNHWKTHLLSSFFEYGHGAGKEGYWTYDHMCLQNVDMVQALYPEYDSIWLFDHAVVMIVADKMGYLLVT
jgi:hypothetical protein